MKKPASLLTVLLFVLFPLVLVDGCRPSGSTPDIASPAAPTGAPATVPTLTPSPAAVPSPSLTPTPTTIAPSPSPTPIPMPDYSETLRLLSFYVPEAHELIKNLTATYGLAKLGLIKNGGVIFSTGGFTIISAPGSGQYVQQFAYPIAGRPWQFIWQGDNFSKAIKYSEDANALATTGKLENETRPRNISQKELFQQILLNCQQASDMLAAQIEQSYTSQEYFHQWIKSDGMAPYYERPPTADEKESVSVEINRRFQSYVKDFLEAKGKLDSIIRANIEYTRKQAA